MGRYRRSILLILLSVFVLSAGAGYYHYKEKSITIVDGEEEITISTRSKTVQEVLREERISLKPEDIIEPELEASIQEDMRITIKRAAPVKILADGKEYELVTATTRVGDILKEVGISLGSIDKVLPGEAEELRGDKSIQVVRVTEEYITDEEKLEYAIQRKPTMDLDKGMTKVVQRGAEGLKRSEVKITYEDGQEAKRETVREEVVIQPKDQIIQVGMNDTITTSRGSTRFEKAMVVTATAYCSEDPGVTNRTSVGAPLKKGVIAVDPRVIPYYTKLYVPGYGFGQALDTGGAIKGNRIDLAMGSKSEALKYGRKNIKIYLLGR